MVVWQQKECTKRDFVRSFRGIVSDRVLKQTINRITLQWVSGECLETSNNWDFNGDFKYLNDS